MVAGSIAGKTVNVIDTQTDQTAWTLQMDLGVRPMAFLKNPDGSTKWIFVQLSDFNGFAVVDFATHKEIKRIQNPDLAPGKKTVPAGADPSHGMAVTPDGKTLVVYSRLNNALYAYSLPDLKLLGGADLGGKGAAWVTLTPDGKTAYVANAVTNDVSVVDIKSLKEVTRIPVGFVPKRNTTGMLLEIRRLESQLITPGPDETLPFGPFPFQRFTHSHPRNRVSPAHIPISGLHRTWPNYLGTPAVEAYHRDN